MNFQILEDLGLTRGEIQTYITLLELGTSHAGEIVNKSSLHTSVIHRALNSLIEKGLINYIYEGKKRIYQATDPKQFYNYIEEKKRGFDEILPELRAKQEYAKPKETASIYKGRRGITEVYKRLVTNPKAKEYITFGGGKECYNLMGDSWWKNIHQKRIEAKLPSKQVFDETVRNIGSHLNKLTITNIKFISDEFASFQETVISGNLVAITIFTDNAYSILIDDKMVAQGYKKYFELLWKTAKK